MNIIEFIITGAIVIFAIFMLYKTIKSEASGKCNCGSCSSHCPKYAAHEHKKS